MNVMTEEEAWGRACCSGNSSRSAMSGPCLASACMAWRWWDGLSDDGTAHHRKPTSHAARAPEPPEGRPLAQRRGYCGLAGRPTP